MTQQRDFKTRVRERMQKTGERYTTARAHLLNKSTKTSSLLDSDYPGILNGYDSFGGIQTDTAIVHNLCRQAGVVNPETGRPFSEAMINGLCGGPGFMYAVFEYKNLPPFLTITMRNRTLPDVFIDEGWGRLGLSVTKNETGSKTKARETLDSVLAEGKAAICVVEMSELPYYHVPAQLSGLMPHQVAVAGVDGGNLWIDDLALTPRKLTLEQFADARAGYRKAKNRLITVDAQNSNHDPKSAILEALRSTVVGYETGDVGVPPNFRVNCGFDGLEKWRGLLTNLKDKKGWRSLFVDGKRAYIGLRRIYDCIQLDYTAPAAGRGFYAQFLEEILPIIDRDDLEDSARDFHKAADLWSALAKTVAECDPEISRGSEVSDHFSRLIDENDSEAAELLERFWMERMSYNSNCTLSESDAASIYSDIAERLAEIIDIEHSAIKYLKGALAK